MLKSTFNNIKIAGVACAVPVNRVDNRSYVELFGKEHVEKVIATTGIRQTFHVDERQTAGDLAYAAAEHLLTEKNIDRSTIGAIIFAVNYPDYFAPSTAHVLQKRLGLPIDCIVFDMNLGCSGFLYGLHTTMSLMQTTPMKRALVLVGDTTSRVVSKLDKSRMLFGDAGAAALLEMQVDAAPIHFGMKNDGSRFKSIIVPAGGFRMREAPKEQEEWFDGNIRSDYELFMDGTDVFNFSMTDVPKLIKAFVEEYQVDLEQIDACVFHQPNAFILKHIARRIHVPMSRMLLSLGRYGNTSGVSIPITLCDAFGNVSGEFKRLLMCAFGVGLSWGAAAVELDTSAVLPIIHTYEFYSDGIVSHS